MPHQVFESVSCLSSTVHLCLKILNTQYTHQKKKVKRVKKYIMHCYVLVHSFHIRTRKTQRIY